MSTSSGSTPGPPDPDRPDAGRRVPLPPDARSDTAADADRDRDRDLDRERDHERERGDARDRGVGRGRGDAGPVVPVGTTRGASAGLLRVVALIVIVGGVISSVAGVITWYMVQDELSQQEITVSEDADNFAGDKVDGPLTAYEEADIIDRHAREETGGLTYAQLDRDDPRREQAMTASFLRASLYTSVVAFGVAAFAMGLGILLILVGVGLLRTANALRSTLVT